MPIYDFECVKCGNVEEDLYMEVKNLPRKKKCAACGKIASQQRFRGQKRLAQITSGNSMYGIEQPAVGVTFNSYEEKMKYLREHNLMETNDPVGGSRSKRREPPPRRVEEQASWQDMPAHAHL